MLDKARRTIREHSSCPPELFLVFSKRFGMETALLGLLKLRFLGDEYLTHTVPDRFVLINRERYLFIFEILYTNMILTSDLRYSTYRLYPLLLSY